MKTHREWVRGVGSDFSIESSILSVQVEIDVGQGKVMIRGGRGELMQFSREAP